MICPCGAILGGLPEPQPDAGVQEFVAYFTSSHTALVLSERGHFVLKGKLQLGTALGREPDEGDRGFGYQVRNRAHQALCVRPGRTEGRVDQE